MGAGAAGAGCGRLTVGRGLGLGGGSCPGYGLAAGRARGAVVGRALRRVCKAASLIKREFIEETPEQRLRQRRRQRYL